MFMYKVFLAEKSKHTHTHRHTHTHTHTHTHIYIYIYRERERRGKERRVKRVRGPFFELVSIAFLSFTKRFCLLVSVPVSPFVFLSF